MERPLPPSARRALAMGEVLRLEQSGFLGHLSRYRVEAFERQYGQVLFVWWATTATGRQARYFHIDSFDRLQRTGSVQRFEGLLRNVVVPSRHFAVPLLDLARRLSEQGPHKQLPRGYTWHGPYLLAEHPIPQAEGLWEGGLFRWRDSVRRRSAGGAACDRLAHAGALAQRLLSRSPPALTPRS